MIKIFTENEVEEIFKRNESLSDKFDETVKQIIEDVKERKDKALLDFAAIDYTEAAPLIEERSGSSLKWLQEQLQNIRTNEQTS